MSASMASLRGAVKYAISRCWPPVSCAVVATTVACSQKAAWLAQALVMVVGEADSAFVPCAASLASGFRDR